MREQTDTGSPLRQAVFTFESVAARHLPVRGAAKTLGISASSNLRLMRAHRAEGEGVHAAD